VATIKLIRQKQAKQKKRNVHYFEAELERIPATIKTIKITQIETTINDRSPVDRTSF
jgi:hypothetical protein